MQYNDNVNILDVSHLESPKPLHLILKHLKENPQRKRLKVIHRIEPIGLYEHLKKLEYKYKCTQVRSHYEIEIWK